MKQEEWTKEAHFLVPSEEGGGMNLGEVEGQVGGLRPWKLLSEQKHPEPRTGRPQLHRAPQPFPH